MLGSMFGLDQPQTLSGIETSPGASPACQVAPGLDQPQTLSGIETSRSSAIAPMDEKSSLDQPQTLSGIETHR